MVWIASTTVSNTSTGTVSFSSIPQTFTHLQIRGFHAGYLPSTTSIDALYFSSLAGSTPSYWHSLTGDGASASSTGSASNISVGIVYTMPTPTYWSNTIIDILDYTNTNKNKTVKSLSGFDRNGGGTVGLWSVLNSANTNAVTSLTLSGGGSYIANGSRFDLYGITTSQVTGA